MALKFAQNILSDNTEDWFCWDKLGKIGNSCEKLVRISGGFTID